MEIRKASLGDMDAIFELYREQFHAMAELQPLRFQEGAQSEAFIRDIIESESGDILLCFADGYIQGFALLQERETPDFPFFVRHRYAYLMDLVTTAKSRGLGYGSSLLAAAKNWASARLLEYIELDVLSNNDGAVRLYRRHGFLDKRLSMLCELPVGQNNRAVDSMKDN